MTSQECTSEEKDSSTITEETESKPSQGRFRSFLNNEIRHPRRGVAWAYAGINALGSTGLFFLSAFTDDAATVDNVAESAMSNIPLAFGYGLVDQRVARWIVDRFDGRWQQYAAAVAINVGIAAGKTALFAWRGTPVRAAVTGNAVAGAIGTYSTCVLVNILREGGELNGASFASEVYSNVRSLGNGISGSLDDKTY